MILNETKQIYNNIIIKFSETIFLVSINKIKCYQIVSIHFYLLRKNFNIFIVNTNNNLVDWYITFD